jgi:hypothetical protein
MSSWILCPYLLPHKRDQLRPFPEVACLPAEGVLHLTAPFDTILAQLFAPDADGEQVQGP